MIISRRSMLVGLAGMAAGCASSRSAPADTETSTLLEVFDDRLRDVVDPGARMIERAGGFSWSEGPAWDPVRKRLYFSDVPGNKAWMWSEGEGLKPFLSPSGTSDVSGFREPGSNGLYYARDGSLLVCNHGLRRVEKVNVDTLERMVVADSFQGKPFNSPNDVVEATDGTLYFTDPPYGLEGMNESPLKAQPFNGVYRLLPGGHVELLVSDMTFPNGVALSPDETRLYITQSDPDQPILRELVFDGYGKIASDTTLFDATRFAADGAPGLPDGLAVDIKGRLFVTGPGGIFVISPDGVVLGRIKMAKATANCTFGGDGSSLYITSSDALLELFTKTRGVQWIR